MSNDPRTLLSTKMLVCSFTVRDLLNKIHELENDTETPMETKISEIKKIRIEISKVGTEIDSIKKELTLLETYNVN